MVKTDKMTFEGVVIDSVKGIFKVSVNENYNILCRLSGKIRQNEIKVLLGDTVIVEVSEYDTLKGRIVQRLKKA